MQRCCVTTMRRVGNTRPERGQSIAWDGYKSLGNSMDKMNDCACDTGSQEFSDKSDRQRRDGDLGRDQGQVRASNRSESPRPPWQVCL